MKGEVVRWLTQMEADMDAFDPVAVDMDVVAQQVEELQVGNDDVSVQYCT